MLDIEQLKLAVDIQQQSYALLKWVAKSVESGNLVLVKSHGNQDAVASAKQWIESEHKNFPSNISFDPEHINELAGFFGTYITSSFDFVPQPNTILVSDCGCYCPLCSYLAKAPYLRPKKLSKSNKRQAEQLIASRVEQLAGENGLETSEEMVSKILGSDISRREAAYSAYGYWLVQRMSGYSQGPAILALWREIAWEKAGSPRKNFKLRHTDIVKSEKSLLRHMSGEV